MPETKRNNLPVLSPPRLPYHPDLEKKLGIDIATWRALCEIVYPDATQPESILLAWNYCKARKLDIMKRVAHIVPIWDKHKRVYVDTIWPGIGELRTTAHRTQQYAGRDKTAFGPDMPGKWTIPGEKNQPDRTIEPTFPDWAQVTVYRFVNGERCTFAGPIVYWLESYGSTKTGAPNAMWQRRPRGQLEKVAEAAALRLAFPEEVGNEYIDAEAHVPDARHVDSYEIAAEEADAAVERTMGSKQVALPPAEEVQQPTKSQTLKEKREADQKKKSRKKTKEQEPPKEKLPVCGNCNREISGSLNGPDDDGMYQCPQCFCWAVAPVDNPEDFMED